MFSVLALLASLSAVIPFPVSCSMSTLVRAADWLGPEPEEEPLLQQLRSYLLSRGGCPGPRSGRLLGSSLAHERGYEQLRGAGDSSCRQSDGADKF